MCVVFLPENEPESGKSESTFRRDSAQIDDVVQMSLALLGLRDEVEQLEDDRELPPTAPLTNRESIHELSLT